MYTNIHNYMYIYTYVYVCMYRHMYMWVFVRLTGDMECSLWHWASRIDMRLHCGQGQRANLVSPCSCCHRPIHSDSGAVAALQRTMEYKYAPERQLDSVPLCHAFRTHLLLTCWKCGCCWWGNLICCDAALWCLGTHCLVERGKTQGFGDCCTISLIS